MIANPASRTGEAKSHIARAGDSRASASVTMHPCSTMLALISASVRSSTFATAFELTATDRKWLHRWLQHGSPSQAQLYLSSLSRSTVLRPARAAPLATHSSLSHPALTTNRACYTAEHTYTHGHKQYEKTS